jgi:hypothetical protein
VLGLLRLLAAHGCVFRQGVGRFPQQQQQRQLCLCRSRHTCEACPNTPVPPAGAPKGDGCRQVQETARCRDHYTHRCSYGSEASCVLGTPSAVALEAGAAAACLLPAPQRLTCCQRERTPARHQRRAGTGPARILQQQWEKVFSDVIWGVFVCCCCAPAACWPSKAHLRSWAAVAQTYLLNYATTGSLDEQEDSLPSSYCRQVLHSHGT